MIYVHIYAVEDIAKYVFGELLNLYILPALLHSYDQFNILFFCDFLSISYCLFCYIISMFILITIGISNRLLFIKIAIYTVIN